MEKCWLQHNPIWWDFIGRGRLSKYTVMSPLDTGKQPFYAVFCRPCSDDSLTSEESKHTL